MKLHACVVVGLALLLAAPVLAGHSRLGLGARYHTDHSVFTDLPYEDGDLGLGLSYQYHEDLAYWELGVDFTPEVGESDGYENYALTPEVNLVVKDRIWRAGLGGLMTYVHPEEGDDDWSDFYWQLLAGISVPYGRLALDIMAYYPFENWGDLPDFEFGDMEFGGRLTNRF